MAKVVILVAPVERLSRALEAMVVVSTASEATMVVQATADTETALGAGTRGAVAISVSKGAAEQEAARAAVRAAARVAAMVPILD